jgi:iron complex transport system ATP-binding protein
MADQAATPNPSADASAAIRLSPSLAAHHLRVGYGRARTVLRDLTMEVPAGQVTAIVGANGSGKSTLLRALARLHRPEAGTVLLCGRDITALPTGQVARQLGMLPQSPVTPDGITVRDLIDRGRSPHSSLWRQWSPADETAVTDALATTDLVQLADRPVDALSGGQRQRVWIAMVVAQGTPLLLLDEPTTFLDLAHQLDVLLLLQRLNRDKGRTVVMVLHDLAQACRFADHLVALRDGAIVSFGPPAEVVDRMMVREVFGVDSHILPDPVSGTPIVVPIARL